MSAHPVKPLRPRPFYVTTLNAWARDKGGLAQHLVDGIVDGDDDAFPDEGNSAAMPRVMAELFRPIDS